MISEKAVAGWRALVAPRLLGFIGLAWLASAGFLLISTLFRSLGPTPSAEWHRALLAYLGLPAVGMIVAATARRSGLVAAFAGCLAVSLFFLGCWWAIHDAHRTRQIAPPPPTTTTAHCVERSGSGSDCPYG